MKRRLEDALQDCLAALATGRATIKECLARYPDLAPDLEPLLRMGGRVQEVYDVEPSPLYAEAARQRFLAALASRRQRALARTLEARPRRALWRWAPAALGSAALVAFATWASILTVGGGTGGSVSAPEPGELVISAIAPTQVPQAVVREIAPKAEEHLARIREAVEQKAPVEPMVIQELREVNEKLAASLDVDEVSDEDLTYIEGLLDEQEDLFSGLGELVAPEATGDLEETISIAATVRTKLKERRSPTATSTPAGTSEASPTPEASPAAEETPGATPEATETPPSTETPEASPAPEGEGEASEEAPPEATAAP